MDTEYLEAVLKRELSSYGRLDTILAKKIDAAENGGLDESLLGWSDAATKKARAIGYLYKVYCELHEFEDRLTKLEAASATSTVNELDVEPGE